MRLLPPTSLWLYLYQEINSTPSRVVKNLLTSKIASNEGRKELTLGANTEQDKNEKQKAQVIPGISKALVTRSLQKFQRLTGVSLVLSAILGAYLLSTDRSLWILAVSHAYGLIAICTVDIFLAAFNFALIRKALLPSLLWAVLTFVLQIGDILTAP